MTDDVMMENRAAEGHDKKTAGRTKQGKGQNNE